jgi:hypothetical protein
MRYGGNYKSRGPQYVRGIQEGNGEPKDGDLWVTYSMNKEDIWVARVPVPVMTQAHDQADDDFARCHALADLRQWNLYAPLMAPVGLDGQWLTLSDADPFDYCRVERLIRPTADLTVEFDLQAAQASNGTLQVEFLDDNGVAASRLELTAEGVLRVKSGARYSRLMTYRPGVTYRLKAHLSVARRMIEVWCDGKAVGKAMLFAPVSQFSRIVLRTGDMRTFPTVDTPADWMGTLDHAGDSDTWPPTASPVSRPPTAGPTGATRCSGPTTTDTMSTSSTAWKTRTWRSPSPTASLDVDEGQRAALRRTRQELRADVVLPLVDAAQAHEQTPVGYAIDRVFWCAELCRQVQPHLVGPGAPYPREPVAAPARPISSRSCAPGCEATTAGR